MAEGDRISYSLHVVNGVEFPDDSLLKRTPSAPYLLLIMGSEEFDDPSKPIQLHLEVGNMEDEVLAEVFNDVLRNLTEPAEIDDEEADDASTGPAGLA